MRRSLLLAAAGLLGASACAGLGGLTGGSDDTPPEDAGPTDEHAPPADAGNADTSPNDTGPAASDVPADTTTSPADAGVFAYRRRIMIKNTASASLPAGLTIRVSLGMTLATLLTEGKVKADYSDLYVIGDGSLGTRDRIVDPATGPAPPALNFALVLPITAGATSTDYALYYGAPSVGAAPSDGTRVFSVYDDFTSGISGVWLKNDAPTTSGGKLVLRGGHLDALTTAVGLVPTVSAVELVATVPNPNDNPTAQLGGTFYYWFGYQRAGDFDQTDPWILWIARGKGQVHPEQKSPIGCEAECDGTYTDQMTTPRYYAIERDPTTTRFVIDGTVSATTAVTNQAPYSVMVRNFMATSDVQIDWIRARTRVAPDPTVTFGAEEKL